MSMRVSEIVSSKIGNAIRNVQTWGGIIYNVKVYGAEGDGTTDDTVAIQNAIDAANEAGGGIVLLPLGSYRITATLEFKSNVYVQGTSATIIMDFSGTKGINIQGSSENQQEVSNSLSRGDLTITGIASTSGFAAGDWVMIHQPDYNATLYPYIYRRINGITSSTEISLNQRIPIDYDVSNGTLYISKVNFVEKVSISGLHIECKTNKDLQYPIFAEYLKDAVVENNYITNHSYSTEPGSAWTINLNYVFNCRVNENMIYGVNDASLHASRNISARWAELTRIYRNSVFNGYFGVNLGFSYNCDISNNSTVGFNDGVNISTRGIKIAGCYYTRIHENNIENHDTGIKNEDSWETTIDGNFINSCGFDVSGSHGINSSSPQGSTGLYTGHYVTNNRIVNQIGRAINFDSKAKDFTIQDNQIERPSNGAILCNNSPGAVIKNNRIREHMLSAAIRFNAEDAVVTGNVVENTDNTLVSFQVDGSSTTNTVFKDNVAINNDVSDVAAFAALGTIEGNNIKNFITKFRKGFSSVVITADYSGTLSVTFSPSFPTGITPYVVATVTGNRKDYFATTINVTNTGFDLVVTQKDGTTVSQTVNVYWIATI